MATQWVDCTWECAKCRHTGLGRVYAYPKELPQATSDRYARETRERCLDACMFKAMPFSSSAAVTGSHTK